MKLFSPSTLSTEVLNLHANYNNTKYFHFFTIKNEIRWDCWIHSRPIFLKFNAPQDQQLILIFSAHRVLSFSTITIKLAIRWSSQELPAMIIASRFKVTLNLVPFLEIWIYWSGLERQPPPSICLKNLGRSLPLFPPYVLDSWEQKIYNDIRFNSLLAFLFLLNLYLQFT